jgi:hypothetical protein
MNIREGARRIRSIGLIATTIATFFLVIAFVLVIIQNVTGASPLLHFGLMPIIIVLIFVSFLGTAFLVTAWIVEGFAKPLRDTLPNEHPAD